MERFRETAFCLTLWYVILAVIVAVLLIALHDLEPARRSSSPPTSLSCLRWC